MGADLDEAGDFAIMPSSLRLCGRADSLRAQMQNRRADIRSHIDLFASDDSGMTWREISKPVSFNKPGHSGNPPALLGLRDGRLALLYGNRDIYAICAKISEDGGATWSDETTLRGGGANGDMGYLRAKQLHDGAVVAAFYISTRPDGDGERYIESLRWRP